MSSEKKSSCGKCQFWKKMLVFSDILINLLSLIVSIKIYFSIRAVGSWMANMNVDISSTASLLNGSLQFILFIYPIIASLYIVSHIKFEQWRIKCPYYKCSYDYEQNIEGKDNTAIFFFDVLFILYIIFVIHNLKPILTSSTPLHALVVSSWICAVFVLIFAILFVD